jgi:hypothetical protein
VHILGIQVAKTQQAGAALTIAALRGDKLYFRAATLLLCAGQLSTLAPFLSIGNNSTLNLLLFCSAVATVVRNLLAESYSQEHQSHRALPDAIALAKALPFLLRWAHGQNPVHLEELLLKSVIAVTSLPAKPTIAAASLRQHIRQKAAAKQQVQEAGKEDSMTQSGIKAASCR